MREILFKAKTEMIVGTYNCGKEDGEWVKGHLRCDCGKWLIYQFEYDRADYVAYEVNPETICQYTGLTDKNGRKIWENDVTYMRCNGFSGYGNVIYENGCFWIDDKKRGRKYPFSNHDVKYRVDGNIFDNPELLDE